MILRRALGLTETVMGVFIEDGMNLGFAVFDAVVRAEMVSLKSTVGPYGHEFALPLHISPGDCPRLVARQCGHGVSR